MADFGRHRAEGYVESDAVIFLNSPAGMREMREVPYEAERVLQELIADHPSILAGEQVDASAPRRWVVVAREAGVAGDPAAPTRWSADHLLLDQDAIPTIVEVKRSTDTRIRREVVGQILEYAANASVYWPVERLRGWLEERVGNDREAADALILGRLGVEAVEAFWQTAKSNLETGRLRLVIVADKIPLELRRIVEFLDDQMSRTRVIAIEVRRYQDDADRAVAALVPRVVAQSARAEVERTAGGGLKRTWDEASFIQELRAQVSAAVAQAAIELISWAKDRDLRLWFGSGQVTGSVYPMVDLPDGDATWTFGLTTNGSVILPLGWMATRAGFSDSTARLDLLNRLNAIGTFSVDPSKVAAWPKVPLAALAEEGPRSQFLAIMDWLVETVRSVTGVPPRA